MFSSPARNHRGSILNLLLFALTSVAAIAAMVGYFIYLGTEEGDSGPIMHIVKRGPFLHDAVERGEVESSKNVDVRCEVKSQNSAGTAILEVVPEGTVVAKGDLLVRLDSSALESDQKQQQITCNTSEAMMIQTRNIFEAALIIKKGYLEGTFVQEKQIFQSEVFVAEENLRRARQYFLHSERLAAKGFATALQLEGDRFAVFKFQNELAAAHTKLKVLEQYTLAQMLKQLDSDIKTAEAQWKAEQSSYKLELDKLAEIDRQIEKCEIRAPQAGQVVHANRRSRRSSSAEFVVEPGALVRESQEIIRLPDPQKMQVKSKVNESRIESIRPGMRASIKLDAFAGLTLQGEVVKVSEYPEPTSWYNSNIKEYATIIKIIDQPKDVKIKPGLTAEVTIHVSELDNVLQVPVQAIYEHGRQHYCLMQQDGRWQARKLKTGATNDKFMVIQDGLEAKDRVAMNPRRYLKLVQLPKLPPVDQQQLAKRNGRRGSRSSRSDESSVAGRQRGDGPRRTGQAAGSGRTPATQAGGRPNPGQIVTRMFGRYDANSDGKLSRDELPAERRDQLALADTNGDGSVDRAELTAAMSRRMQSRSAQEGGRPRNRGGAGS